MSVTYAGRPIVANERDRTITFTNLGVDWATAGYTTKLKILYPDGSTTTEAALVAVSGEPYQAELTSTAGLFPYAGQYKLKVVATDGTNDINLGSVNYTLRVYP